MQTISDYIQEQSAIINEQLKTCFPEDWSIPSRLKEAMLYSLLVGGKRIRPIFVLAACEAMGGNKVAAMPAALSIEMIHTYSLIHDDLPAMDNDDYRRGKLTNHKVFGDAMAILAGDGLLTHAFYMISNIHRKYDVPAEQALNMIEELSIMAGPSGMVGGQAADMLEEQGMTSLDELKYIHLRKTSDLIVYSLRAGSRVAGASDAQLAALTEFGRCIGLAFQIQDDILDVTGDEAKIGKSTHSDDRANKVTYPYFIGLEASIQQVESLTERGLNALKQGGIPHPERLIELAEYLMKRDH